MASTIPGHFVPSVFRIPPGVILFHYIQHKKNQNIPSFIALKFLLATTNVSIATCPFTPIIPYPATEFDTIYTCMKRFQDILHKKTMPYGPLWCDEGVYRIAMEIQLLKP